MADFIFIVERIIALYKKIRGFVNSLAFIKEKYPVYGEKLPFQLYALWLLQSKVTDKEFLVMMKTKVDELEYLQTNTTPQKLQELIKEVDPSQSPITASFVNEMERILPLEWKLGKLSI